MLMWVKRRTAPIRADEDGPVGQAGEAAAAPAQGVEMMHRGRASAADPKWDWGPEFGIGSETLCGLHDHAGRAAAGFLIWIKGLACVHELVHTVVVGKLSCR
jgi:hypothetical protein